jgi:hypothetical protein
MGSNITKDDAIEMIKSKVEKYTDDFEIKVVKRKPKDRATKVLVFALTVKAQDWCEDLFSDFMKDVGGSDVYVIQSDLTAENRTTKEIFLIGADVKVWDDEEYQ